MRLTMDARARRLLRRMPVVNVYSAVEIALIAVLAAHRIVDTRAEQRQLQ